MKKLLFITILMVLGISLLSANAVALLSSAKGKVELRREAKTIKFRSGDMLLNNDEIRTGGESFAAYKYIDATTTIKVFSNSFVRISAQKSGNELNKNARVNSGSVYAKVTSGKGTLTVQTPTSVASVKGTGFMTKVNELGESMFIVTEGTVEVSVIDTRETQSVKAGNTALVDRDGNLNVRESNDDDLSELERAEIESSRTTEPNRMTIPVSDENGTVKYIEITW